MIVVDIIEQIRVNIDDIKRTRYKTDIPIYTFINSAIRKVFNKLIGVYPELVTVEVEQTISNQSTLISWTPNPYKLVSVQDNYLEPIDILPEMASKRSYKRAISLRKQRATDGSIKYYLIWWTSLNTDLVLTIQYIPKIDLIIANTENIFIIPDEYENLIVLWATILALSPDEERQTRINFVQLYGDEEQTMFESLVQGDQEVTRADSWYD